MGDPIEFALWPADETAQEPRVRAMVEAFGSVWVADERGGELLRVDRTSGSVTATLQPGPSTVVAGTDSVWFVTRDALVRIDPQAGRVMAERPDVGGSEAGIALSS